jgi:preprotein translocase subunit SecA
MRFQQAQSAALSQGAGSEVPSDSSGTEKAPTFVREQPKVGRNEPCSCGSGKKYKQCCGKVV